MDAYEARQEMLKAIFGEGEKQPPQNVTRANINDADAVIAVMRSFKRKKPK